MSCSYPRFLYHTRRASQMQEYHKEISIFVSYRVQTQSLSNVIFFKLSAHNRAWTSERQAITNDATIIVRDTPARSVAPLDAPVCAPDGAGADVEGAVELVELVELLLGPVRKKVPAIGLPMLVSAAKSDKLKLFRAVDALTKFGATLSKLDGCVKTTMT